MPSIETVGFSFEKNDAIMEIKIEEYLLYTAKSGDKILRVVRASVEKLKTFAVIGNPFRLGTQYTKTDAIRNTNVSNIAELELGQKCEIVGVCYMRTQTKTFYDIAKCARIFIN